MVPTMTSHEADERVRLFHFSENPALEAFEPVDGLVWAIDEHMAVNYLLPRDCPRVTFGLGESTDQHDRSAFEAMARGFRRVVAIEHAWMETVLSTKLTRYEFDPGEFSLSDANAGYWTSPATQVPVGSQVIGNLEAAIRAEGGLLIAAESLWPLVDQVSASTLRYSIIRQGNAQPRLP